MTRNKRKIFNDPIYGFISIPHERVFDIIEHRYFQRLRRITQLGLTGLVYSGANHTRFQHTLGAMHLMSQAIQVIRSKGTPISEEEEQAAVEAILLHDIGHGPFSHTLEYTIVNGVDHEWLSLHFMDALNGELDGALDLAISIFKDRYDKPFLHQLVSSQLDVDRLDYLRRDSFFTGVSEGVIGSERIIKMLTVSDNRLVVEAKGVYSIEKFLIARRLMYWQVYLHKTVLAAENLLIKILKRAKYLALSGEEVPSQPPFRTFLYNEWQKTDFMKQTALLEQFSELDDIDIMYGIKQWCHHADPVLSRLSDMLINRRLFRIELRKEPFEPDYIASKRQAAMDKYKISEEDAEYFVFSDRVQNRGYDSKSNDPIRLIHKDGTVNDITAEGELAGGSVLMEPVTKYFMCYPKNL